MSAKLMLDWACLNADSSSGVHCILSFESESDMASPGGDMVWDSGGVHG